jgi:hypothetical protein
MSEWMPEPKPGQRRYQVCEACWYARHGGQGRLPERVQGMIRHFTACPCALCGETTDSGHYMPLYDREVRTIVPVVFKDGPRAGDTGQRARMCDLIYDTAYEEDGSDRPIPIRYDLELIGGEQWARVAAIQPEDVLHGDGIIRS